METCLRNSEPKGKSFRVDTFAAGFLRSVAQDCVQAGWRVWFRPNQVVHWAAGHLVLLLDNEKQFDAQVPAEVELSNQTFQ